MGFPHAPVKALTLKTQKVYYLGTAVSCGSAGLSGVQPLTRGRPLS
jgi:hypothetical protein